MASDVKLSTLHNYQGEFEVKGASQGAQIDIDTNSLYGESLVGSREKEREKERERER